MIWDVVKAAVNQPKERIGGQMLTYLRRNDGHGKPHHENIKSFKSGGIFAFLFTKGQCSSPREHGAWRLGGNCWRWGVQEHTPSSRARHDGVLGRRRTCAGCLWAPAMLTRPCARRRRRVWRRE